jgi:hypothetical protein
MWHVAASQQLSLTPSQQAAIIEVPHLDASIIACCD